MEEKNIEIDCDQERFNRLCINPQIEKRNGKSLYETRSGLQGENQGLYKDLQINENGDVILDFEANEISTGRRIYINSKSSKDFGTMTKEKRIDTSYFSSYDFVYYNIGKEIPPQKTRFIKRENGPQLLEKVLYFVNLENVVNYQEKPGLISAVLEGVEFDKGLSEGIIFINYQ